MNLKQIRFPRLEYYLDRVIIVLVPLCLVLYIIKG